MGRDDEQARSSLRFSLGHTSVGSTSTRSVTAIAPAVERARAAGVVSGARRLEEGRLSGACARCHVRRCRLGGGRGASRRRRARRDRRPPRAVAQPRSYRSGARGCCTIEDSNDARRAADVIGIPFYVWDLSDRFHEDVVEDFMAEYSAGRTPNPCLRCNERIKFAAVLDRAVALGLRRGRDRSLRAAGDRRRRAPSRCTGRSTRARTSPTCSGVLTQEQLAGSLFPLGGSRKARGARGGGSPRAAGRAEAGQPRHLLHRRRRHRGLAAREARRERSGDVIVDHATGEVVGHHDGAYAFTVGQRRGLRLGRPAADGRPAVRARHRAGLRHGHGRAARGAHRRPHRGHPAALVRPRPDRPLQATVQLRAHGGEHRAVVTASDDTRGHGQHRAARPRPGDRARTGGGRVRRLAGRRVVHDRRRASYAASVRGHMTA